MRRTLRILVRIAGSSLGFLVGWLTAYLATGAVAYLFPSAHQGDPAVVGIGIAIIGTAAGLLIGAPLGAAIGAAMMLKVPSRRRSFWKGLLGAGVGLLVGVLPTALCLWALFAVGVWHDGWWPFLVAIAVVFAAVIAGAVTGSGWTAKPANIVTKEGGPPASD